MTRNDLARGNDLLSQQSGNHRFCHHAAADECETGMFL
jgi:hypothetical protein